MVLDIPTLKFPFQSLLLIACLVISIGAGCQSKLPQPIHFHGKTMGTTYSIQVVPSSTSVDAINAQELQAKITALLKQVNMQMSTYIKDSEISQFNRSTSTDWFPVSQETQQVVQSALEFHEQSDGAFDCTVAPLIEWWGFGSNRKTPQKQDEEAIQLLLTTTGSQHLQTRTTPPAIKKAIPRLQINLSAIAKGDAVDRVAELIIVTKPQGFLVEIGGEIRVGGFKADGAKWNLAIEAPKVGTSQVQRMISKSDCAIATSGDYRNFIMIDGKRFSHTITPKTGFPVLHQLGSVTVLAENCRKADALATSLMVLGPDAGYTWAEEQNVTALFLVYKNDTVEERMTSQFQAEIESAFPQKK